MLSSENLARKARIYRSAMRRIILFSLCLCVLSGNGAERFPPAGAQRFEYFRMLMGTKVRVVLYADTEESGRVAASAAFERIGQLDEIMSDYNPESELMQICRKGHERPVSASRDLFVVLGESVRYWRLSHGAFDVTVGPLVALWREARRSRRLPDPGSLKRARALVGSEGVLLDPAAS